MAKKANDRIEIFLEDGPMDGKRTMVDLNVPDHLILNLGRDRYEYTGDRPPLKKLPRRTYTHNPEWQPASVRS